MSVLQAQHFYVRAHIHYVIPGTRAVCHHVTHAHLRRFRGHSQLFTCESKNSSVTVGHEAEPTAIICVVRRQNILRAVYKQAI